jgi:anti-sigma factor RsiW
MGELLHLRGDPHEATMLLLPWYVTGAIEPGDRLLVDAHLAGCEECRGELAAERRLRAAVADLPAPGSIAPVTYQGSSSIVASCGSPRRWRSSPIV